MLFENTAALRDITVITKDGEWGKGEPGAGLIEMRVIRGTDFDNAQHAVVTSIPIRHIPEQIASRKRLEPWDILIETAGGSKDRSTGRTMLVKPSLLQAAGMPVTCASFARFIRIDTGIADPAFVYWFFQSMHRRGLMEQHQVQHTGIARFQFTRFAETIRIPLPPLPEQRRIAAVLGALDDKIELNRRMNRTLEEMAQVIFQSWFVNFGGQTEFEDSGTDLGKVPKGWEITTVGQVLELAYGKSLPKKMRDSGHIPVYGSGGIDGYHSEPLVPGPGIVIGRKGTIGSVHWEEQSFFPIDTTFYIRLKDPRLTMRWAYHKLELMDIAHLGSDSAVPGVNRHSIYARKWVIPTRSRVDEFQQVVSPLTTKIRANTEQSRTLAELRDTLLPKLISGEIRVREAEERVQENG